MNFTPSAQKIFDAVYAQSINRQIKLKHPKQPALDQKHWNTICHNFAVLAANAYEGKELILDGEPFVKLI